MTYKAETSSEYVDRLLKTLNDRIKQKKEIVGSETEDKDTRWLGITIGMPPIEAAFKSMCTLFEQEINQIRKLSLKDLKEKYGDMDIYDIPNVTEYFEKVFVIREDTYINCRENHIIQRPSGLVCEIKVEKS